MLGLMFGTFQVVCVKLLLAQTYFGALVPNIAKEYPRVELFGQARPQRLRFDSSDDTL